MNINTELLEIFGSFEFAAGESQLPSACPGSFGQAGATIDGSWEREVYDALKAAELAVLKEELDKLRPRAAASCAGDPKILEPAKCDDRMDGGLPVFEAINSGNCSDCGGCEPQNDQGNQRYNNAHADSRDELVYVHNTAGPVTSSCPAAHDSSKTVVFELPVELASRSYVYSRGCSLAGGLSVSISTSRAAVVYWCAPGVARVHGNAALELAIDCAKALSVPVLAVSIEQSIVFESANEFNNMTGESSDLFFVGIKRKHMLRLAALCSLERSCAAIGLPILSCSVDDASPCDIFETIRKSCDEKTGELVIFTDFVAHAAHQQQCMSLASHQTEFAIDPFEETSVVNKVAYNGFTILGVEHGGLISLLPGLSDTDAHHEQSESPPAKKRRADSIAIGSNVTLAAFSDVYSNAAGCILQGCANMKIYHDNATQQIANQIRAFELCLRCCSANDSSVDSILQRGVSQSRWNGLQQTVEKYRIVGKLKMEVVTQFSSMFLWEYPSSVTRNDIFQQLIFDDIRKPGPVIDPENPEARWKAYSVTRFHCNTRNKLNKQARAIKSLVDLTVAGVLSQREVIRNIYFRAAACFPLACDEILIVAHQLWNEIWYDFMVIEYCQYCVFEGRINGMLSEKDSSAPARDIMSQSSLSKMSALLSYFSKSPIKKDQTFPAEIFTGLTSDSVFNAIQSTLCYSGIILNFQLGYYWVLFILLNLPTAEMGLRAVISELAVQSLRDEHCSRDFALVQLGVLLDSVHELDYLISPSMSIEAGDAAHHAPQFFCLQDMLDSYCREWFKSEHDRSAFLEWCAMFLC